jgi:hypothetical protein
MHGLGRVFDLSVGFAPVDTQTGANTGKRIRMLAGQTLSVVLFKAAGVGTDVPIFTLNEANASSGGTSQALAKITTWHKKSATTLAGTETWTTTTQAAGSTLTLTGEATKQGIYVFDVDGASLSDGFNYVSVDVADTGSAGAQLAGLLYLMHDLTVQRKPANLAALLA